MALIALAGDVEARQRYESLTREAPNAVGEESAWLAAVVREALAEAGEDAPWCVLYLVLAYVPVLVARIDQRLNPRPGARMPSPFVYAMQ